MGISETSERRLRAARAALTLACALLLTAACAAGSYAGIPLARGAADSELQALARLAQAGDKPAQLALGIRYEEGRGLPADSARAGALYRLAAVNTPVSQIYSIPGGSGGRASTGLLYPGGGNGLPYAMVRYCALVARDGPSGEGIDCAHGEAIGQLLTMLSYDLNFDRCAVENGFGFGNQSRYREVRACLLGARSTLACTPPLSQSLGKVDALAAISPRIAIVARPIAIVRQRCGFTAGRGLRPGEPTPIDSIVERRGGVRRSGFDISLGETLWPFLCHVGTGRDPIERTPIEDAMCAIWRNPGANI